jgi:hypothetical protein
LQYLALEWEGSEPVHPFGEFFAPLFTWVADRPSGRSEAELLGYLASDEVRKSHHDDMTLVLAVRPL